MYATAKPAAEAMPDKNVPPAPGSTNDREACRENSFEYESGWPPVVKCSTERVLFEACHGIIANT
jgi:hypothetical protein